MKATWNNNRGLLVSFRSSGVLVGAAVQIRRSGTHGFDSSVTSSYQLIAIPVTAFAIPDGSTVNQIQIEDFGAESLNVKRQLEARAGNLETFARGMSYTPRPETRTAPEPKRSHHGEPARLFRA